MSPTRDEILLHLNVEIEKLERRLAGYEDRTLRGERHGPSYNRTIEQKQRLIAERDRLLSISRVTESGLEQEANSGKLKAGNPDVARRRALAKSNRNVSATEMSEIFDRQSVPLPAKWQDAGFQTWCKAYKNPAYRKRIDVLISKDRRTT